MGSGAPQLVAVAGGAMRKGPRLAGLTKMFLLVAFAVFMWQASLFIGQHYYAAQHEIPSIYSNATGRYLHFGQLLHSTQNLMNENFDAAQNVTAALVSRIDALQLLATDMDGQLKENQRDVVKAVEAIMSRLSKLDDADAALKATLQGGGFQPRNSSFGDEEQKENVELLERLNSIEEMLDLLQDVNSRLERKMTLMEDSASHLRSRISQHLSTSVEFRSLRDMEKWVNKGENGIHGFLSDLRGRGRMEGPPELFLFPSNLTGGRLLCLQGNHTSNGTQNSYAYAFKEGLPIGAVLLPGTTLISDTFWDYSNPWHSMYNLIQFVHWKMNPVCQSASRLVLFHWSELRTDLGYWIKNVFEAANLPTVPETLSYDDRPVCFEDAVVSRSGIGGVPGRILKTIYEEVRCNARRKCGVTEFRSGPTEEVRVRVTLMVRTGARGFVNLQDWEDLLNSECRPENGCSWSPMFVSNLTFCEQVTIMSKTDVLVTVHGAQLANMIFLSPGSRIMEMFPRGWQEFAGHGQFIYSHLASWVGLRHEGYWRDLNTPSCPDPNDPNKCFSFYKDQPVGINATHISKWLRDVVDNFNHVQAQAMLPVDQREDPDFQFSWDNSTCSC